MRLFIADPGLRANIGHHANGCRHIVDHARARGIETHILAHQDVDQSLRTSLQARPFFKAFTYDYSDGDPYCGWLSGFHKAAAATSNDLNALSDVGRDDVVFFHGAQPAQFMAAADWVNRLPENKCPLVIVELATEPGVDVEMEGSRMVLKIPNPQHDQRPTLFRFVALSMERIKGKPFRLITYNADVSAIYSELLRHNVGVMPFPTPPDTKLRSRAGHRPITISVLGHQQFRKGYHLMPTIVEHMLRMRSDIDFLIHNSDPLQNFSYGSLMRETQQVLRQMAESNARIRLEERAVDFEEWVQLLDESDLILCPYEQARYAHGHSGLASMAIANAIPLVVPARTPLATWVERFGDTGVMFESFDEPSIIEALERAIDGFDLYAERAVAGAARWNSINGPDKFIDAILKLSQQRRKGALPEVVRVNESAAAEGMVHDAKPPHVAISRAVKKQAGPSKAEALTWKTVFEGNAHGIAFAAAGDLDRALRQFDTVLRQFPAAAETWFYRGAALKALGRLEEAYEAFAQAVMLVPAYRNAEAMVAELGPMLGKPATILTPWIKNPRPGFFARSQAKLERSLGRRKRYQFLYHDPDEKQLRGQLLANPDSADAATALGRVLVAQDRILEGELFLKYALQFEPWNGEAVARLCSALDVQPPKLPQIADVTRAAIVAGSTDDRLPALALWAELNLARWQNYDELRKETMAAFARTPASVPPFMMLHHTNDVQIHKACAEATFEEQSEGVVPVSIAARPRESNKLTVGYVSADFRIHAVAHLCAELFELHDRKRITVVGFGTCDGDIGRVGQRIRGAFDQFVSLVGFSRQDTLKKVLDADIDILVDLTGHTTFGRPDLFAAKPAPIAVNFLGYPGTLGSSIVDYVIADKMVVPAGHEQWFSERVVRMPACYQVNDRKRPRGHKRLTRAQAGLPEEGVVFCCFNEVRKILPPVFAVWMRLLKRIPNSVLWLYASHPVAIDNLRREASVAGVEPHRLIFAGRTSQEDHMSRYRLADIFLDTQPYGAHTTASDALWAGCPVITLLGEAFAGRVGGSLLTAVGLPELITTSWAEYEELAVRLATDSRERATLRRRLEQDGAKSPLFDSPRFVRQLEWAYDEMWRRYSAGEKPQSFDVPGL